MEDIFVVMKKIIGALLVASSVAGCSTGGYYADRSMNTVDNYDTPNSIIGLAYNLGKSTAYKVPKDARVQHENCVMMSLDNGNPGDSCSWRTDNAYGNVRVTMIKPNLCHTLTSTVYYKGKSDSWQDEACLTRNDNWTFYNQ
jgi:hypothetical protein|tara:strand:- start:507 stop:932 length:426 start_codon:yes stop_codon:yes gene_type:complete